MGLAEALFWRIQGSRPRDEAATVIWKGRVHDRGNGRRNPGAPDAKAAFGVGATNSPVGAVRRKDWRELLGASLA